MIIRFWDFLYKKKRFWDFAKEKHMILWIWNDILHLRSVWIELILLKLKTENWKHCSKIIFKCVNSIVGPIFNEKVDKKWSLWVHEQCISAPFIVEKSTKSALKKKNLKTRKVENVNVDVLSKLHLSHFKSTHLSCSNSLINFINKEKPIISYFIQVI